jgi:hypothetical protein
MSSFVVSAFTSKRPEHMEARHRPTNRAAASPAPMASPLVPLPLSQAAASAAQGQARRHVGSPRASRGMQGPATQPRLVNQRHQTAKPQEMGRALRTSVPSPLSCRIAAPPCVKACCPAA